MARLVLLNGAPGSGKSTLARRYVQDHALALALDIDVVRAMIGRWLDLPGEAGRLARRMAVEMARTHLQAGHDVVVAQFLGRLDFVLVMQQLCEDVDAEFVEVALLSSAQDVTERFIRRAMRPESAEHQAAMDLLERRGGIEALPGMYDRLLEVVASRPNTHTIVTVDGQVEQAYADLLARLATHPLPPARTDRTHPPCSLAPSTPARNPR